VPLEIDLPDRGQYNPMQGKIKEAQAMKFQIEVEQEVDGRWIAEIMDIPGVMVYGENKARAIAKAKALALRVLADWMEDEDQPERIDSVTFAYA
jgi:predicted RNase H-like HicB family nuclease